MFKRFSIRSLLITTVCVSLYLAFTSMLPKYLGYLFCICLFSFAGVCLGRDVEPNCIGMVNGLSWGLVVGSLLAHLMLFVLPKLS